jgi:hypothetical protein
MKIIITEEQSNTISDKLKSITKKIGWRTASKSVGGFRNLAKLGFNDDPMEFLNLFSDLDFKMGEINDPYIYFRDDKNPRLMVYDQKNKNIYISYPDIWEFLFEGFDYNSSNSKELVSEWLGNTYNLWDVNVSTHRGGFVL